MKPRGKTGGPPPKAKYYPVTDSGKYREGKVKRTPVRGVKENLKPCAYKQPEGDLRRAFCRTGQRAAHASEVKRIIREAAAKAGLKRAK